jgi:mycothiol synthase
MAYHEQLVDHLDAATKQHVDALIAEVTAHDEVAPVGEHKYLMLTREPGHAHAALVWNGDRLDGYAQLAIEPGGVTVELTVRPNQRGLGLGSRLIGATGAFARTHGHTRVKAWAYGALPASDEFAAVLDARLIRVLMQLERPLGEVEGANLPAEYRLRTFREGDEEPWLALNNRVFAGHPENGRWTIADLRARQSAAWYSADDVLIAEREGRMAGFHWIKRVPDAPPERPEGEIYIIGVDESERGRGLGRALAQAGLRHMRDHGMRVASLYVEGDNQPALALYRSLGFGVRRRHHQYLIDVRAMADRGADARQ